MSAQGKRVAQPPPVTADAAPRCWHCRHKLAEHLTRPWRLRCPQCRALNASPPA